METTTNPVREKPIFFSKHDLTELFGDGKVAKRFFNPIKTPYQLKIEEKGWILVGNEIATNYHIRIVSFLVPLRELMKSL
tara:strand:- start:34 stop:273 length:240 start_codon:yes stop_codon:yes gene_type:complete